MSRRDELLVILSSLLLLASTILLAHSMGVITGPRGLWGPPIEHRGEMYDLCIMPETNLENEGLDKEELIRRIDESYADVERIFEYDFTRRIRITAAPYLDHPFAVGATSDTYWGIFVELVPEGTDKDTIRHELIHVMVAERNLPLPYAINEGLAYYYGNPRGWDPTFYGILRQHGPADSLDRPGGVLDTDIHHDRDLHRLATGWAIVAYLARVKGLTPREISELREFPDPHEAWEGVRFLRW